MAHLFRNVKITSSNIVTQEAGTIIRCHCKSEVMPDVCEAMSWSEAFPGGSLVAGVQSIKLAGSMSLAKASFSPNGMKEHNCKLAVSEARDFEAVVTGRSEESEGEVALKFILVFPPTSVQAVVIYLLAVGQGDAVLHLHEAGKNDELDLQPVANDGPALASVREVGAKRRGKVE
jgi:hypothetical protein